MFSNQIDLVDSRFQTQTNYYYLIKIYDLIMQHAYNRQIKPLFLFFFHRMDDYNVMMNSECANVENNEPSQVPSDQLPVEQANNEVVETQPAPDQQQNNENVTNSELDSNENGDKNTSIEQNEMVNEPVETNETNETNDTEQPTDASNTKDPDNSNGPDAETESETKENENENDDCHNDNGDALVKILREEEEPIDPSQCRICLSKDNLLDIFTVDTKTHFRICDLIMKLCATVKISERDYLPHYVCNGCIHRIDLAWELRTQCEETEKLLRSKLKRSKKTTRRAPSEFVLISAIDSSTESEDGDNKSEDEEFKLSEVESEQSSETSDSDVSFHEKKKPQPRRRRPPPPKSVPVKRNFVPLPVHQPVKQSRIGDVISIPAIPSDDDKPLNRRSAPLKRPTKVVSVFKCDICNRFCSTADALQQHRRTHTDEKCPICAKIFRPRSLLLQHIQKHKEDSDRVCGTCHKTFPTISDCKRHIQLVHSSRSCNKCKRSFSSKARLDAHKCNDDAGRKNDGDHSTNTGRDLFKSVAPLTTTYWSDSFSD